MKTPRLKILMLSVAMALGMLLPVTTKAQSDDFFRDGDNNLGGDRFMVEWVIINNGIGQREAPLGSGLLILGAAGAVYAVSKRRRDKGVKVIKGFNGINAVVIALTLVLGMTNCRKNIETIKDAAEHGVHITLNVDGCEKAIVNPTGGEGFATVEWETGDYLYVGNNGKYCGYLYYNGSEKQFKGSIYPTSGDDGDYLHFYYIGGKGTNSEPTSVDISDQTRKYPVISYGRSTSLYNSGITSYSTTLYNKCAIGKFSISGVNTNDPITITGMNNTVTVNFAANNGATIGEPFSFSKSGRGFIRLHAESNTERWAILLPQDEVTTATAYTFNYKTKANFTVPAVSANEYYDSGITVAMSYASSGKAISINKFGDLAFFAPGNLKYDMSTNTWNFMEHQWSTIEKMQQDVGVDYAYQEQVGLFGWGTSGYNHGANCYQPYSTNEDASNYYAYGSAAYNLYDNTGQADWGYAANIANLGGYSTWRTLTSDEWYYLLNTRKVNGGTGSGKSYTLNQKVNGILGVVLYPDNYTGVAYNGGNDWSYYESKGCVFLPAAGYRYGIYIDSYDMLGYYWASNCSTNDKACGLYCSGSMVDPRHTNTRNKGFSVRLARPVE